jgi:hypothetical protein
MISSETVGDLNATLQSCGTNRNQLGSNLSCLSTHITVSHKGVSICPVLSSGPTWMPKLPLPIFVSVADGSVKVIIWPGAAYSPVLTHLVPGATGTLAGTAG